MASQIKKEPASESERARSSTNRHRSRSRSRSPPRRRDRSDSRDRDRNRYHRSHRSRSRSHSRSPRRSSHPQPTVKSEPRDQDGSSAATEFDRSRKRPRGTDDTSSESSAAVKRERESRDYDERPSSRDQPPSSAAAGKTGRSSRFDLQTSAPVTDNAPDFRVKRPPLAESESREHFRASGAPSASASGRHGAVPSHDNNNSSSSSGSREYGKPKGDTAAEPKPLPEPVMQRSSKLYEEENKVAGVSLKYVEPPEARRPTKRWRLYPVKDGQTMDPMHIHRKSSYLFGKDQLVADIHLAHPSCSKQHAVLQFKQKMVETEDGSSRPVILPYIIDLESTNGTFLNKRKIDSARYYELREKDSLSFGFSTRSFVLLHDRSGASDKSGDAEDDTTEAINPPEEETED